MRETLTVNLAAERQLFAAMDTTDPKYPAAAARIQRLTESLPPKRERVVRPVDGRRADDLEADVIKGVGELLSVHPRVLFAVRQNTGAMPYTNNAGRVIPVWFYKKIKAPGQLTIVDYWGFLAGFPCVPFAFECKRPSWTAGKTLDERELRQQVFLHMIKSLGGVSGFVTNSQQVADLLT
jgi:hypothetical protein